MVIGFCNFPLHHAHAVYFAPFNTHYISYSLYFTSALLSHPKVTQEPQSKGTKVSPS